MNKNNNRDMKQLKLLNDDAARMFIELDDVIEAETGQSMLGTTKPFLMQILQETDGSAIPGAFNQVLNSRLTGKLRSASIGK